LKKRLEVFGNGIGSDLLDKRGIPKAGERRVGRRKQRELASALQGFDQPRTGNQGLEGGVSCRIHHNVHDGGWLFVLVWLAASGILDSFLCLLCQLITGLARSLDGARLDGARRASWCFSPTPLSRLERAQGSKTAQRLGAAQAEA